jgi:hypothetical protein
MTVLMYWLENRVLFASVFERDSQDRRSPLRGKGWGEEAASQGADQGGVIVGSGRVVCGAAALLRGHLRAACSAWVPAFAGMTVFKCIGLKAVCCSLAFVTATLKTVTPAQAGTHNPSAAPGSMRGSAAKYAPLSVTHRIPIKPRLNAQS